MSGERSSEASVCREICGPPDDVGPMGCVLSTMSSAASGAVGRAVGSSSSGVEVHVVGPGASAVNTAVRAALRAAVVGSCLTLVEVAESKV